MLTLHNRLILDADNVPMVVPFVHTGMQDVMPIGATFPRIGKTVSSLSIEGSQTLAPKLICRFVLPTNFLWPDICSSNLSSTSAIYSVKS